MTKVLRWTVMLTVLLMTAFMLPPALAQTGSIAIGLPDHIAKSGEEVVMQLYKLGVPDGDSWSIDSRYSEEIKAQIISIEADLRNGEEKATKVEPAIEAIRKTIEEKSIASIQTSTMREGTVSFSGLDEGLYYAVMTKGPEGFIVQSPVIPIPYRFLGAVVYEVKAKPKVSEVKPGDEFTSRSIRKIWADADNLDNLRPGSLTVYLLADGQRTNYSVTLNNANGWKATLEALPLLSPTGSVIVYTWDEESVPGYTLSSTEVTGTTTTLTNTHNQQRISRRVRKVWDDVDNIDGLRPESLQVTLLANGTPVGQPITLNANNNWSAVVNDLPAYNAAGNVINYSWREADVEGYKQTGAEVNGELVTLTNTHAQAFTSTSVRKIWDDNDDALSLRPEKVIMELLADGTVRQSVELNKSNNWSATVSNLPLKNAAGNDIAYTWHEKQVLSYTLKSTVVGEDVTTFTNAIWTRKVPPTEEGKKPPKIPGIPTIRIDDYETPLGIGVILNHVGDCYE